ncbi:MAG: PD-(D/E)XK nuclease family protein [Bacteroidales bacterium]|nr:PD-(D/E)XK nuclease family protein [Bacteroidales bacterium]
MNDNTKTELSNLIKDPKLEELSLSLHTPNFFSILNATKTEIRHSNFLAWLMSPNESHNLNTIFIKWFLKEIFSSEKIDWANEFSLDSFNLHSIKIYREWQNIDILILHKDFVIVIENKVDSSEHSRQLKKYSKIVNDSFPKLNKAFVFLTIDGLNPKDEEDASQYISIDYGLIKSLIEIILSVYKNSLSQRIQYYIEDYLLVLNRYIMKEHESVKLAQELYKNHKEAINFIIENIPDKIAEVREIIEDTIVEEGYVLETCNKYYARFLTKNLSTIIPKSGIWGWKGNESFLFEVAYWEKGLSLKFVISPGNEKNRQLLSEIMKSLPKSKKATGKKWWTFYSDARKVNFTNEKYDDKEEIKSLIQKLIRDNKELINKVENKIIDIKEKFEK